MTMAIEQQVSSKTINYDSDNLMIRQCDSSNLKRE